MKLKALAAAVALTAVAGTAQAGWNAGEVAPFTPNDGNGELLFLAWDEAKNVSVIQDLGTSYTDFLNNSLTGTTSRTYGLDSLFDIFADKGSDAADIRYSVVALNDPSTLSPALQPDAGFMVTSNAAAPSVDLFGFNQVFSKLRSGTDTALDDSSANSENNAYLGDVAENEEPYAGANSVYGRNILNAVSFDTTAASNESLYMWAINENDLTATQSTGFWNFNLGQGTLTYSAVPVPAAVWLFASGLLGLGAISRRKKA